MGDQTTRVRATNDAMKDARAVLAREVVQPRMKAVAALARAAESAADPDQIRQAAHRRADLLTERAQQRGQELIEAARRQAQQLREKAANQRRELMAQAELDVQATFGQWQNAYQAACAVGWTADQLLEVGHEPPPSRRLRRAKRRRSPVAAPVAGRVAAPGTVTSTTPTAPRSEAPT